jgi:hypothetical protein
MELWFQLFYTGAVLFIAAVILVNWLYDADDDSQYMDVIAAIIGISAIVGMVCLVAAPLVYIWSV